MGFGGCSISHHRNPACTAPAVPPLMPPHVCSGSHIRSRTVPHVAPSHALRKLGLGFQGHSHAAEAHRCAPLSLRCTDQPHGAFGDDCRCVLCACSQPHCTADCHSTAPLQRDTLHVFLRTSRTKLLCCGDRRTGTGILHTQHPDFFFRFVKILSDHRRLATTAVD